MATKIVPMAVSSASAEARDQRLAIRGAHPEDLAGESPERPCLVRLDIAFPDQARWEAFHERFPIPGLSSIRAVTPAMWAEPPRGIPVFAGAYAAGLPACRLFALYRGLEERGYVLARCEAISCGDQVRLCLEFRDGETSPLQPRRDIVQKVRDLFLNPRAPLFEAFQAFYDAPSHDRITIAFQVRFPGSDGSAYASYAPAEIAFPTVGPHDSPYGVGWELMARVPGPSLG